MAGRGASLGPLLIISAIDLLLCCLTAAVMLFLIFQPSQRADRSSALFQGTAGADSAQQLAARGQQAPTIIMVDNSGDTKLVAAPGSDYQVISSASTKSTLLRSLGPVAPLHLVPADPSQRFIAHIAVTKDGGLFSRNKSCAGGTASEVSVDPSSDAVITMICPRGGECIREEEAHPPENARLVLLPKEATTPAYVPTDQCYPVHLDESLESIRRKAEDCNLKEHSAPQEFLSLSDGCLWKSFDDATSRNCEEIQGPRVGFWKEPAKPVPKDLICPVPADDGESGE